MNEGKRRDILIVDDEPWYVDVLQAYLTSEGFVVSHTTNGESALSYLAENACDLLLLDLNLPGISGIEVFREIRRRSAIPVIMVTTRGEEIDRVVGLELGADDYVAKPFSPRELVARVKSVLRRSSSSQVLHDTAQATAHIQRFGDLEIDRLGFEVRLANRKLQLTPTEYRLLDTLAQHPGQVFTRAQLLDLIAQGHTEIFDRTLDRHIANLRKKLQEDVHRPQFITTVTGVGYKFLG